MQTLTKLGIAMTSRDVNLRKYLFVETSFLHRKDDLRDFENNFPIKVIFLPARTPMLNPTEYFFNEIKSLVKVRSYKSRRSYADVLSEMLKAFNERKMFSYFLCIRPYVELALKQQPFK